MGYATVEELTALFGGREMALLSTHGDSEELDAEALERAIGYACSEVDSYLASRYAVPLAEPVPHVVMMAVGDIVRYRLTSGDLTEKDPILARCPCPVRGQRRKPRPAAWTLTAGARIGGAGNAGPDANQRRRCGAPQGGVARHARGGHCRSD